MPTTRTSCSCCWPACPSTSAAKSAASTADRGYDAQAHRQRLQAEGIVPRIAKRRTAHSSGLGRYRWVVERTVAWLHQFRRLRLRYERHGYLHRAFVTLAAALILARHL